MPRDSERQGGEIEITPEMVGVGVLELVTFGDWDQAEETARRVYLAMEKVRRTHHKV